MKWQNEAVFGLDLSIEDCDYAMFNFPRKDWVSHERSLFTHKWFDYRFMHPVHATYLYAHEFGVIYRNTFARTIDKAASKYIRPLKKDDFLECDSRVISGIWHGRQFADALGIPYDVFIQEAFSETLRYWKQRHLPRAWQIYSERTCSAVAARWEEMQRSVLLIGEHPEFTNARFVGSEPQCAHHEWLFDQAYKRVSPIEWLHRFCMIDQILPIEKIEARLGSDIADRVRAY